MLLLNITIGNDNSIDNNNTDTQQQIEITIIITTGVTTKIVVMLMMTTNTSKVGSGDTTLDNTTLLQVHHNSAQGTEMLVKEWGSSPSNKHVITMMGRDCDVDLTRIRHLPAQR